ncbi:hypothetical protein GUJ93_ZPchr0001g29612 [Zizania palustris]|uniref:Uncharacterized protein n=1 Tax=Zizania palustris TaxID=103762 RepID=A0A8J5RAQ4_ZIZPA|nr:hypothetical protein GUJ93_ZPchr0001g29612 [Zizania palustris]
MGGSLELTNHDREEKSKDPNHQRASIDNPSIEGTHASKASLEESNHDCTDDQKSNRPMSPGTLALMCDEQDTMFAACQNVVAQQAIDVNLNRSELYAEQERCVLTEFRDCLRKLVTYGRMKEEKYSMAIKSEVPGHPMQANGVSRIPYLKQPMNASNNWYPAEVQNRGYSVALFCKTWMHMCTRKGEASTSILQYHVDQQQFAVQK